MSSTSTLISADNYLSNADLTGIDYGFGTGVEIAYKFGYQNYVFANIGYIGKRMKPFDDEEFRLKSKTLSGLAFSIGVSF